MLQLRTRYYKLVIVALIILITCADSTISLFVEDPDISFDLDGSMDCNKTLFCLESATTSNGSLFVIPKPTPDQKSHQYKTVGLALYNESLQMFNIPAKEVTSFSTSFELQMTRLNMAVPGEPFNFAGGDGMVFFFTSNKSWIGGPGGNLGLYKSKQEGPKILAVEFDTFWNWGDNDPACNGTRNVYDPTIADQRNVMKDYVGHIGVLYRNRYSTNATCLNANGSVTDVSSLRNNEPLLVWIDYNGSTYEFQVRISTTSTRPTVAFVHKSVNLLEVCSETMWVGFSAANQGGASAYEVHKWRFNSTFPSLHYNGNDHRHTLGFVLLGVSVAVLSLLAASLVAFFRCRCKATSGTDVHELEVWQTNAQPRMFDYKQLYQATSSFKKELGTGEFEDGFGTGTVFRGVFPDGQSVFIKKMDDVLNQRVAKEFSSEISALTRIRHRNIIQLMGWCGHKTTLLLVYEFIPDGTLHKALFGDGSESGDFTSLSWPERHKVICEVASALEYLHEGWIERIIHRNVKSSNVFLDKEFGAKLGNFGLARVDDTRSSLHTTNVGEMSSGGGYLAPETAFDGRVTIKTDVYAFGVLILEVACGKSTKSLTPPNSDNHMHPKEWTEICLSNGNLLQAADERLEGTYKELEMKAFLLLGLVCTDPDPCARPTMRQVIQALREELPLHRISKSIYSSLLNGNRFRSTTPTTFSVASEIRGNVMLDQ